MLLCQNRVRFYVAEQCVHAVLKMQDTDVFLCMHNNLLQIRDLSMTTHDTAMCLPMLGLPGWHLILIYEYSMITHDTAMCLPVLGWVGWHLLLICE